MSDEEFRLEDESAAIKPRNAAKRKKRRAVAPQDDEAEVGELATATHGSPAHPLRIGDIEIPCYVLSDQRRVIVQQGMIKALGIALGSGGGRGRNRVASFAATRGVSKHLKPEVAEAVLNPIRFRTPQGRFEAYGYEATVLADLCDAVLEARRAGDLTYHQARIADQCEMLVRSFARVGIIALVDEATGYQRERAKDALSKILEMYISKELASYATVFTDEFYYNLFQLRGWSVADLSKRPGYTAELTKNIVYRRLAPGVLDELQRVQLRGTTGRPKHSLYQRLTGNHGYPRLKEHMAAVVALMKAAPNWTTFERMLNRALPKYDELDLFPGEGYGTEGIESE